MRTYDRNFKLIRAGLDFVCLSGYALWCEGKAESSVILIRLLSKLINSSKFYVLNFVKKVNKDYSWRKSSAVGLDSSIQINYSEKKWFE